MRTIDDFTVGEAAGAGLALTALNPKSVLLVAAAAVEIAAVGLASSQELAVLLAFVAVASIGVLTPLVLAVALGERSREPLERVRGWMVRSNTAIMTVLFLVIGAKLIGDAIAAFG